MKTKEMVYIVMDLLKNVSDDAYFTEDHVLFLLNHHRALILKKEQERQRWIDNTFNQQTLCLDMAPFQQDECGETYLRSEQEIPETISNQSPTVSLVDFYAGYRISFVSAQKMKYVNNNRFMRNIIYCSIGPDKHLYMKSSNVQFMHLERVMFQSVFEDTEEADGLSCFGNDANNAGCDYLDKEFPIDSYLVPSLIDSVLRQLLGAAYRGLDKFNNSKDDISDIAQFINRYLKNNGLKQDINNEE